MSPPTIDEMDARLLALLQEDASPSTGELAERLGMSQSVCWRRIQRLKDVGIIRKQVVLVDRARVGFPTQLFAQVKLSAHGRSHLSDFANAIQTYPEVLECYVLLGASDFLLRIVAESIEAYERFFFDKLSQIPGVQEVTSSVALSEIKATTVLPVVVSSENRSS